ncbi:MAG: 50S ribosomal protein L17 [Bacteroidota bacterium]
MRHRKSGRKLKRTASHRRATLASLSTALLRHKRIMTTVAKAKETRKVVEKLITRAKNAAALKDAPAAAVHARREVGRLIKDRAVISELFTTIAERVATRPGGYTRIVKLGQRLGDAAEMAVIELVDFNTGQEPAEKSAPEKKAKKTPRPGKGKTAKSAGKQATDTPPGEESKASR